MHCNPFDLFGLEQCLYIVGLQSLPHTHTHKVCYRWTLLSMGFMFRIEYHRTLANGCFENRSITVWTWSDGFHIQLWGAATDRTRKRAGEGGGRLVRNTFFDCSHVCGIMYCSHYSASAFSAGVFTLPDRERALSRASVYRCSWTHPRPAALRGSSPMAPGHAKDIIFVYLQEKHAVRNRCTTGERERERGGERCLSDQSCL